MAYNWAAAVHYGIPFSAKDVRSFCRWSPHKRFCQADSSVKHVLAQPHNNRFESCNTARRWNLVINKDIIQACILFALYRRRRIPGMQASGNAQCELTQGRCGECWVNGTMLEEWWPEAQRTRSPGYCSFLLSYCALGLCRPPLLCSSLCIQSCGTQTACVIATHHRTANILVSVEERGRFEVLQCPTSLWGTVEGFVPLSCLAFPMQPGPCARQSS